MNTRFGPWWSITFLLASSIYCPARAQTLEVPDEYQIENLGQTATETTSPTNRFLVKHQGRLLGLPFPSNSIDSADDYGSSNGVDGDPVWDEYGLGVYYTVAGGRGVGGQISHTNFITGETRRITNGKCIPGIGASDQWDCSFGQAIASTDNRIAFFQEIIDPDASPDRQGNKHLVIGANGKLSAVRYFDHPAYHLDWSPDGDWLIFAIHGALHAVHLRDPDKIEIYHCELWDEISTQIQHPEWANAGSLSIVFASDNAIWDIPIRMPKRRDDCPTLRTNQTRKLTPSGHQRQRPQWLNVGKLVAYRSYQPLDENDTSRQARIWALSLDQAVEPRPVVQWPSSVPVTDWQRQRSTAQRRKIEKNLKNLRENPGGNLPGGDGGGR